MILYTQSTTFDYFNIVSGRRSRRRLTLNQEPNAMYKVYFGRERVYTRETDDGDRKEGKKEIIHEVVKSSTI